MNGFKANLRVLDTMLTTSLIFIGQFTVALSVQRKFRHFRFSAYIFTILEMIMVGITLSKPDILIYSLFFEFLLLLFIMTILITTDELTSDQANELLLSALYSSTCALTYATSIWSWIRGDIFQAKQFFMATSVFLGYIYLDPLYSDSVFYEYLLVNLGYWISIDVSSWKFAFIHTFVTITYCYPKYKYNSYDFSKIPRSFGMLGYRILKSLIEF